MKNYLGNLGGGISKVTDLVWHYLFIKNYWVYLLVVILMIFLFSLKTVSVHNPFTR